MRTKVRNETVRFSKHFTINRAIPLQRTGAEEIAVDLLQVCDRHYSRNVCKQKENCVLIDKTKDAIDRFVANVTIGVS